MANCPNCRTNIGVEIFDAMEDYRDEIKENLIHLIRNNRIDLNIDQDEFIKYVLFGE